MIWMEARLNLSKIIMDKLLPLSMSSARRLGRMVKVYKKDKMIFVLVLYDGGRDDSLNITMHRLIANTAGTGWVRMIEIISTGKVIVLNREQVGFFDWSMICSEHIPHSKDIPQMMDSLYLWWSWIRSSSMLRMLLLRWGNVGKFLTLRISISVILDSILSVASSFLGDGHGQSFLHLCCSFSFSSQSSQASSTTVQGDTARHILWVTVRKLQNARDKLKMIKLKDTSILFCPEN